jgi:hypothetical protein
MIDPRANAIVARSKAISWHEVVCAEYGLPVLFTRTNASENGISISDQSPKSVASAIYEPGIRRWLVDTGCPFDLIAHKDLDKNEIDFIKTAS